GCACSPPETGILAEAHRRGADRTRRSGYSPSILPQSRRASQTPQPGNKDRCTSWSITSMVRSKPPSKISVVFHRQVEGKGRRGAGDRPDLYASRYDQLLET